MGSGVLDRAFAVYNAGSIRGLGCTGFRVFRVRVLQRGSGCMGLGVWGLQFRTERGVSAEFCVLGFGVLF